METMPQNFDLATVMELGIYLLSLLYVIFSLVFYYHWMQYAVDVKVRRLTFLIYLASTLPLIAIMGLMIFLE